MFLFFTFLSWLTSDHSSILSLVVQVSVQLSKSLHPWFRFALHAYGSGLIWDLCRFIQRVMESPSLFFFSSSDLSIPSPPPLTRLHTLFPVHGAPLPESSGQKDWGVSTGILATWIALISCYGLPLGAKHSEGKKKRKLAPVQQSAFCSICFNIVA